MIPTIRPAGGGALLNPASLGPVYAWFQAWNNTHLTVNPDGSGGPPANGQAVGRWTDISGHNNHLNQTVGNSSIWFANAPNFPPLTAAGSVAFPSSTTLNASLFADPTATTLNNQNASGGLVGHILGFNPGRSALVDFGQFSKLLVFVSNRAMGTISSLSFQEGPLFTTGRKCVVTWRSNGSDFIVRCNGASERVQQFNLGSSLSPVDAAMSQIHINSTSGGALGTPLRLSEWISYSSDIGATNIVLLERYLRQRIGGFDTTRNVFVFGDSLTQGIGSVTATAWTDYVSNRPYSAWYLNGTGGQAIFAGTGKPSTSDVIALKGSNEGIFIMWLGANDLITFPTTGANIEGAINAYCTAVRAAGYKVIVTTMPAMTATAPQQVERISLNNLLVANFTSYADAIVRLDTQGFLSDPTNLIYYQSDGVHLTDAAYTLIGGLFQTAMAGIPAT